MQGSTTQTLIAAWLRGFGQAALVFIGTMLFTQQQLPESMARGDRWEQAAISAGIATALALGWRGGAEGTLDGFRQSRNMSSPADVTDDSKP